MYGISRSRKVDQPAQDAALGLASQAEQNKIVPRQKRVGDLWQNRFFVTVNPRKKRLSSFELLQEIRAKFFLDGAARRSRRVAGSFRNSPSVAGLVVIGVPYRFARPLYATRGIAAEFRSSARPLAHASQAAPP
jgi:hypothetical protein